MEKLIYPISQRNGIISGNALAEAWDCLEKNEILESMTSFMEAATYKTYASIRRDLETAVKYNLLPKEFMTPSTLKEFQTMYKKLRFVSQIL